MSRLTRKQNPRQMQRRDVSRLRCLMLAAANRIRAARSATIIDQYWSPTGWPVLALLSTALHSEIQRGSDNVPCFGVARRLSIQKWVKTCSGDKSMLGFELPLPRGLCRVVAKAKETVRA